MWRVVLILLWYIASVKLQTFLVSSGKKNGACWSSKLGNCEIKLFFLLKMTFANSLKIFAQREVSFVRNVKAFQEEKCLNRKPVCSQLNENNINQLYNQDLHTTLRYFGLKNTFFFCFVPKKSHLKMLTLKKTIIRPWKNPSCVIYMCNYRTWTTLWVVKLPTFPETYTWCDVNGGRQTDRFHITCSRREQILTLQDH